MDFRDNPEEAAYRQQVRDWLIRNAPERVTLPQDNAEQLAASRAWQLKKAEAGYAKITWPKEWGGGGGTQIQQVIYSQEEAKYETPPNPFFIGLGMCIPTVMATADEATKQRFVGPALRGEELWCQLFSEPSAGSDVAAVRMRAVREGNDWVINGQKIWTTVAHIADYGIVLVRTDPDVPKHQGLTMFWVDMKSPGIEVRPIHQMSGGSEFNEVFFTDVRIPDSQRLGDVNDGWRVSLITLMNERLSIGSNKEQFKISELIEFLEGIELDGKPALGDSALRQKIAEWYVQSEGLNLTNLRTLTSLSRGETPGPENSFGKVVRANLGHEIAHEILDLVDQYGVIFDPELSPQSAMWHKIFMLMPGLRIAGGTDEVLRNIIAERVLGLPAEIRVDKNVPFKDIPKGR